MYRRFILIIVVAAVLLGLIVFFLPSLLGLFSKDIVPTDDSDLRLKKISVSENENAYYDLIKLEGNVSEPAEIRDYLVDKAWDDKIIAGSLEQNRRALEYFTFAALKPGFQDPNYADPEQINPYMVLTPMGSWRSAARLSALKSLYLARQSRGREAFEEAMKPLMIGQKIQESQASLVEYLVASAMKSIGLETIQKLVSSLDLSSSELKNHAQLLEEFYRNENSLKASFKGEYRLQAWTIDSIVQESKEIMNQLSEVEKGENISLVSKTKNNFYFKPNETKALFAELARKRIKETDLACGSLPADYSDRLTPLSTAKLYFTENAVGKVIYDLMNISLAGIFEKKCDEDLLVAATQILLALKAYQVDNDTLPLSLGELVPQYLAAVPTDPFDGRPIRYSSAKRIIYSVGKDLTDTGGSADENWQESPDPTFKIPF